MLPARASPMDASTADTGPAPDVACAAGAAAAGPPADAPAPPAEGGPLFRFDPGWLFLLGGAALIGAMLIIPALDGLRDARHRLDAMRAEERFRAERLANYTAFLDALRQREPTLVLALATTQLNEAPEHLRPIMTETDGEQLSASVFAELEPAFTPVPEPAKPDSRLQRWATDTKARPWLLAFGAICVLIGVLPPARPR